MPRASRRSLKAEAAGLLLIGSAVAAVSAWVTQAVVARLLGPGAFAEFMSLWGIVFFLVAMLQGVQQEVVRSHSAGETRHPAAHVTPTGRLITVAVAIGLIAWLALSLTAEAAVGAAGMWLGAVLTLGIPALLAHQVLNGLLAGSRMWGFYAASITLEAVSRTTAVVVVVVAGVSILGQTAAIVFGGAGWLFLALHGRVRVALAHVRELDLPTIVRNASGALVATSAAALVVNAFPVLLQIAGDARGSAEAGVVIAAVVLTRAPLLMPLYALQGLVIGMFTRATDSIVRPLTRVVAVTSALAAGGAGLAALVGPTIMVALFGDAYVVSGALLAGLVGAAGLTAILTVCGWAALARGLSRSYAIGWAVTPVVLVLLLRLPIPLGSRSVVALSIAPVVGAAVMAIAARLEKPRRLPTSS